MRVPVHIMGGRVRHITNCLYRSSRHSIVRCAWKCSWGDQDMIAKGRRRRLQHLIGQKAMWRKICFCLSRTSDQAMPPTLPCLHCDRSWDDERVSVIEKCREISGRCRFKTNMVSGWPANERLNGRIYLLTIWLDLILVLLLLTSSTEMNCDEQTKSNYTTNWLLRKKQQPPESAEEVDQGNRFKGKC